MTDLNIRRHELKYYISNTEYYALVNRLVNILDPDRHSIPHKGYFIRSLYFDSHDDESLVEKLSGIQFRRKYRMRIYSLNTEIVKFEIKNKWNNQIFKETATISRESAIRIIDGHHDELLQYNNPILNKIYSKFTKGAFSPRVIIDYTRDAFIYDFFNLRITIDKDPRSNNTDLDLFSEDIHTVPVILEDKQILEIKYESCLPEYIQRILQLDAFERSAISKYTLGRRFLKINSWEDN